jgi:hypothetical protein
MKNPVKALRRILAARTDTARHVATMRAIDTLAEWDRDPRAEWRAFLATVERERRSTGDARRRELLARLAGSVRALGGLPRQ